jgi:hypothetical protein
MNGGDRQVGGLRAALAAAYANWRGFTRNSLSRRTIIINATPRGELL